MAKIRKNYKLNQEVVDVLAEVAQSTNNTDTRVVEAAIVAYGAKILRPGNICMDLARAKLIEEANKNNKT